MFDTNKEAGRKGMAFKKGWLFLMLAGILVLSLLPGCAGEKATTAPTEPPVTTPTPEPRPPVEPTPVDEVSLEEAEGIVGVPLAPKYLPAGWEFRRGFALYQDSPPRARLTLYFSDKEMTEEVKTLQDFASLTNKKIILNVDQIEEMPSPDFAEEAVEYWGGKVVDISGVKGHLGPGSHDLHWFLPGLHFFMYVVEGLPEEQVLKIAESIK